MTSKRKTLIASAAVIGAMAILTGCATPPEYLDRNDRITLGAGDAVSRNKAVHIINPRPRHAYRTHIHFDGQRINGAMDNYHKVEKPTAVESNTESAAPNPEAEESQTQ